MIHDDASKGVLTLALIGSLVGIGQLLASEDKLTLRLVIGRAITSGALGMAAGAVIAFYPLVPFEAQIGIAAVIASLGTSALEKVLQRILGNP